MPVVPVPPVWYYGENRAASAAPGTPQGGSHVKIIQRYIGGQLLKTFLISLGVFTFILFMGNVIRILDMLERGVAGGLLLKLFLSFLPYLLVFSIPMSVLTACLLVFGRLSADNEITAMRACGLTLMFTLTTVPLLVPLAE